MARRKHPSRRGRHRRRRPSGHEGRRHRTSSPSSCRGIPSVVRSSRGCWVAPISTWRCAPKGSCPTQAPTSTSPTRSASLGCSTISRRSPSLAARSCPTATEPGRSDQARRGRGHRPHRRNFADAYEELLSAGGAAQVSDAKDLATAALLLLEDAQARQRMMARAEVESPWAWQRLANHGRDRAIPAA